MTMTITLDPSGAAEVMAELRKAGVPDESLADATVGALRLATHGALSFKDASRLTVAALETFAL